MPSSGDYTMVPDALSADIANGANLSAAFDMVGKLPCGIIMPAGWDAANLTFQASLDNATFNNVFDDSGNEYTVQAAVSRHILLDPTKLLGARYLKMRSGTSGTPVNQTALRTLKLVVRYP